MSLDRVHHRSLRDAFLAGAAANPQGTALRVAGADHSYEALERRARQWCQAMLSHLDSPPQRVAVFAYRSEVAFTGTLAALFAGATFVPLNRTFPVQRTQTMLRRADVDVVIVDQGSAAQLAAVLEGLERPPLVLVPETGVDVHRGGAVCDAAALERTPPATELPPVLFDDLAYLLFTSGTTGEPKGVGITHGNVLHYLDVMGSRYGMGAEDRASQTYDHTFDLAVFDMFMAWQAGACLCAMRAADLLAAGRFIREHQLSVWFSVPSTAVYMRRRGDLGPGTLTSLRLSLFCGEALPRSVTEAWQAAAPNSRVENLYGPTELTISCHAYAWDPATSPAGCVNDVVPIGRPNPGLGALLVDEQLREVAPGEPGELLVCGPQTAPGYWRDPARTAERFVELEVPGGARKRYYRTGDRAMRVPGGDYVYLGRNDHQIKRHGYRIEPAEIEGALLGHGGVAGAVAIGWPLEEGSAQGIIAFLTGQGIDHEALQAHVRGVLPNYMVPTEYVALAEFPLNVNGKTDRAALLRWLQAGRPATGP
jgi:amino acid adenylation domain-containing protein